MSEIKVLGLDPAVKNFGIVRGSINLDDLRVVITCTRLIQTEKAAGKTVRKSSDDLRRAREIAFFLSEEIEVYGVRFIISEIPSGAQSARAAFLLGAALGLVASVRVPIIQVNPIQTKMVSVGRKDATKQEIIAWAAERHPHLPWLLYDRDTKNHKKGDLHDDNEHVADAIAATYAGVQTDEFKQAIAIMRSMVAAA